MWAWLSNTASMSRGRKGNFWLRMRLSARRPWYSPQSRSSDWPHASTWCIEPVTVRAAPQKVTVSEEGDLIFRAMQLLYHVLPARSGERGCVSAPSEVLDRKSVV